MGLYPMVPKLRKSQWKVRSPSAPDVRGGSQEVVATTSTQADAAFPVWDVFIGSSPRAVTHTTELDNDERMSQKSSSSLPNTFKRSCSREGARRRLRKAR